MVNAIEDRGREQQMNHNAGATHVTIRPLAARDRVAWAEMWSDYLAFYDTDLPNDIYNLTFSRLLSEDHADMFGQIAEVNGEPAGIVHCILHAHCWKPAPVCYLQDLFTRAEMRGRGVARALIESVRSSVAT